MTRINDIQADQEARAARRQAPSSTAVAPMPARASQSASFLSPSFWSDNIRHASKFALLIAIGVVLGVIDLWSPGWAVASDGRLVG
jgi:hypothetical protein